MENTVREGSRIMSFLMAAAVIFVVALGLATFVYIGERREGHARDD
jgi:hypothetical protein